MLVRLSHIEIGRYSYPMAFTLGCLCEFNKFGQAMNDVSKEQNIEESANAIVELLATMIHAGTEYSNIMHLKPQANSHYENGEFVALTKTQLKYLVPADKDVLTGIGNAIKNCIAESKKRDIQAVSNVTNKSKKKR